MGPKSLIICGSAHSPHLCHHGCTSGPLECYSLLSDAGNPTSTLNCADPPSTSGALHAFPEAHAIIARPMRPVHYLTTDWARWNGTGNRDTQCMSGVAGAVQWCR